MGMSMGLMGARALSEERIRPAMAEQEEKAWDALARYKFMLFGYHAAMWVNLNKLLDTPEPNPFKDVVMAARRRKA